MRNCQVVAEWGVGEPASTQHLMTDGETLWSYALVVGYTDDDASKVVLDYTGRRTGHRSAFVSLTTSSHVGLAKRVADRVEEPSSA